jgi:CSLREA domain-containing protein
MQTTHTRTLLSRLALICGLAALFLSTDTTLPRVTARRATTPLAANIIVNSTSDAATGGDGLCTLREAITNANDNSQLPGAGAGDCAAGMMGLDNITFSLGAGPYTINVTGAELPTITEPVNLNGSTGNVAFPRVELNGAGAGGGANGLVITTAGGNTISSLVINNFDDDGIEINGPGGNLVRNCYIGTDAAGATALPNALGIFICDSPNNTIGGTTVADRNIISGNYYDGVFIETGTGNTVAGNFIGTDVTGLLDVGNGGDGVFVSSKSNTIGGTTGTTPGACTGACNLISGNDFNGVFIGSEGGDADDNFVQGNFIGLKLNGNEALGNEFAGVYIVGGNKNTIGGTTVAARNIISGNGDTGVDLDGEETTQNLVQGNYIGTNAAGTAALGNYYYGVVIEFCAQNNTIGGTADGARNVISGNDELGVYIVDETTTQNLVQGNYIGTDAAGTAALGNGIAGVLIDFGAHNNTIGGTTAAARNVISGNGDFGVGIGDEGTNNNLVQGNYIGTNAAGTAALGNYYDGVVIAFGAQNNTIGGTTAGARNIISGNGDDGVETIDLGTSGNLVQGNFIGTDFNGTADLGNGGDGVIIDFCATNNTIGGTASGAGNLIFGNDGDGVDLDEDTTVGNAILGNSIFNNDEEGIDLTGGPTPNDTGDGDTGQNNLQNYPLLGCAQSANGTTVVQGTFNSLPTTSFRLEFFANAACDTGGFGEGQTFLGFLNVTTDASGNVVGGFSATFAVAVAAGQVITATATRLDAMSKPVETSEFSACQVVVAPTVTINDVTLAEGNAGTTNFNFTVTLSNAMGGCLPVTVNFATANGTAMGPSDFTPTASSITFNPPFASNTLTQTITVPVIGDLTVEANETFFVNLTAVNATATDAQGQGTINNDDTATIAINDVSQAEGNAGTTNFVFTVTLSQPSSEQITVNFATANSTATTPSDYVANAGTLTFAPGVTSQMITVTVNGDLTVEANETFLVNLSGIAGNAAAVPDPTFADNAGQGTITNDDTATVAINNVSQAEGNAGTTNFVFTVTLSQPSSEQVTVNFATANGTATAPGDYASNAGTLTFAPSVTSQMITVQVNGDLTVEANETFLVNLSAIAGNNAAVPDPTFADNEGQGTITNDDTATIAINDVSQAEGNAGTTNFVFTVTLSRPSSEQVTVNFATANGTATSPSDYATNAGTLTFAPGVTSQMITVQVNGDLAFEPNETFLVNLSAIAGNNAAVPDPTFADPQGQGTILNDDVLPPGLQASIADPFGCTGPGDALTVTAQVTNPNASAQTLGFTATLPANLPALPGTCATNVPGLTCVIAPNQLSVTVTGTLGANQTVTITYQVQVGDAAPGVQLCINSTASFPASFPVSVQACATLNCPAVGPGVVFPAAGEVSDQRAGSVMVYNLYSSSIAAPNAQNTRISITNTHPAQAVAVHLFFVDGATCSIADSLICLTANQTASFLASDIDPGTTGYIVAVASDRVTGCPINFNYLIGDAYVKLASGHAANLAAEGFGALSGGLPACDANSVTAILNFDGVSYNRAPRVLAASNIPSRADGNDTLLVLNRIGGSLVTGAATLSNLFGIIYDDAENPLSFTFNPGVCQFRSSLSNNFPRLTPRFDQFIPAGRSGWAKFYATGELGLLGAQLNFNPNAGTASNAFNQGHNLHKLTLTQSVQLTIPIFPPNC